MAGAPASPPATAKAADGRLALIGAIFDGSPLGIVVTTMGGTVVAANPALQRLLRAEERELIGAHVSAYFPAGDERASLAVGDFLAGRADRTQRDLRLRRRDGTVAWVRISGSVVTAEDGQPYALGMLEEVTAQRDVAAALRASEQRLALALEATHTGWWEWCGETRLTFRGVQSLRLIGRDPAAPGSDMMLDASGRFGMSDEQWRALMHPDDRAAEAAAWAAHVDGRAPRFVAEFRVRAGAAWRWIQATGSIVERDAAGKPRRALGTESDVTSRREAEEALRRSERRFRSLSAHSTDIISVCDASGVLRYVSPSHLGALGYRPMELEGVRFHDILHPGDLAGVSAVFDALLERPDACTNIELRVRHRAGGWRWMDVVASNLLRDPAIAGIVLNARDVTERRDAEHAMRGAVERARLVERATNDAVYDYDIVADTIDWSENVAMLSGDATTIDRTSLGWWEERLHPDDRARALASLATTLADPTAASWREEYRFRRADGSYASVLERGYVLRDAAGHAVRMVGALMDVTERRRLEEQLRHAQKMEAVGQLAGGVAHDFNNLLTVIFSGLELAREVIDDTSPARSDIDEVLRAAQSAAQLTKQLLAFSRKQVLQPRALDVGAVVRAAESMLARVIGERLVLEVHHAAQLWPVHADPGQLEQVLVNLVVNARDAMPEGGTIILETAAVHLAEETATLWGRLPPGDYVRLTVADSGTGMDALTRARIFEPFFTTKPVGKGTGLGLATVYGIAVQSGGTVQVESAPGRGSIFHVLLPRVAGDVALPAAPVPALPRGSETVLLVEDEAPVRHAMRRTLERHGYTVLEARHGADGLLVWRAHRDRIALVLTDLRMPELGGREMAAQLRGERPDLPVIYISGYADEDQRGAPLGEGELFVAKPFLTVELLAAMRKVLDRK